MQAHSAVIFAVSYPPHPTHPTPDSTVLQYSTPKASKDAPIKLTPRGAVLRFATSGILYLTNEATSPNRILPLKKPRFAQEASWYFTPDTATRSKRNAKDNGGAISKALQRSQGAWGRRRGVEMIGG